RGAGDDAGFAAPAPAIDLPRDRLQPGPAVRVGERDALAHLLGVLGGMEIVALLELAAERGSDEGRDRGLPGPGDAHDDGDDRLHDAVGARRRPGARGGAAGAPGSGGPARSG